jgi:predicted phosphodiesterase
MRMTAAMIYLLLFANHFLVAESVAEDFVSDMPSRFTQASQRTFQLFGAQHERSWQGPFFFMQLADTQYGMFTNNRGFAEEVTLVEQTVQHINRLRPRFVIVCGDLTNATPEHDRYQAQVKQYQRDFSQIDPDIPLVCVCGNHDIGNRPNAQSIASYCKHFGDDYFSFWVGGVYNLVLNSSVIKDPSDAPEVLRAQQVWLDEQLAEAQQAKPQHILLFQHHPLFLQEENEPDEYFNIPLSRRTPMLGQLKRAGVRAIFAGHYHRNSYGRAGEMEMVTTGPVGRPLGNDPSGFRIVKVHRQSIEHQYYGMDEVPPSIQISSPQ